MKKAILILIAAICSICASAELKVDGSTLAPKGRDLDQSGMGSSNTLGMSIDWPKEDADGNEGRVALLEVKFKNVPDEEIERFSAGLTNNEQIVSIAHKTNGKGEKLMWIFIPIKVKREAGRYVPQNLNYSVRIKHPDLGADELDITNLVLNPHDVYEVTIINSGTQNIEIDSTPQGALVFFDGSNKGETPITIKNVTMGQHRLQLGKPKKTDIATIDLPEQTITVSPTEFTFKYDLMKKRPMTFKADPSSARIRVLYGNEELVAGYGSVTADVPYGNITVEATDNGHTTSKNYKIGDRSNETEVIRVIPTRQISIVAYRGNNETSTATIELDYQTVTDRATGISATTPYILELSYGKHIIGVHDGAESKRMTINVDDKTDPKITFNLPAFHYYRSRWNPFDINYQHRDWAFEAHYIYRTWHYKTKAQSYQMDKNLKENKNDNGIGIGISYNHSFAYGQGLRTGIHWHYFFGSMDYDDGSTAKQHEHRLYIPLQYQFMLPLTENMSIYVAGGIAGSFGLSNKEVYNSSDGKVEVDMGFGKEEQWATPEQFQWSVPLSVGWHYKALSLKFDYEIGLTNNKGIIDTYVDEDYRDTASFKMRMMTVTLGVAF